MRTTSSRVSMESMPSPAPMSGAAGSTDSAATSRPRVSTSLRASSATRGSVCAVTDSPTAGVLPLLPRFTGEKGGLRGSVWQGVIGSRQAMKDQAGVGAAEAEGALEHVFLVGQRACGGHDIEVDVGIGHEVERGEQDALACPRGRASIR